MRKGRPFLALAAAETLSLSGTRLSTIAIPWLVLSTTGSPVLTGLTAMVEMLPYVVAKALGGPLIDRVGAKRIAIACDIASVAVVGLVPLLDFSVCSACRCCCLSSLPWACCVGLPTPPSRQWFPTSPGWRMCRSNG